MKAETLESATEILKRQLEGRENIKKVEPYPAANAIKVVFNDSSKPAGTLPRDIHGFAVMVCPE